MSDTHEMPRFESLRSNKPGFRGHTLEALGSTLWTLLFLSHLSSTVSLSYGRGASAWQTVPLCALPVLLAGLPGALERRPGALRALTLHLLYALLPGVVLLFSPVSLPLHLLSAALIHVPLALGVLPSGLSATGAVSAWGGLSAALVALNGFSVVAPLSRPVGFALRGCGIGDAAIAVLCAAAAAAAGLAVARAVGFARYAPSPPLDPAREAAIAAGLLLSALCEEVLFRGVLLNLALQWDSNTVAAVAVSSVAFALAHLKREKHGFRTPNWRFAVTAGVLGVFCGIAWIRSGRIIVSAVVNAVFHYVLRTLLEKTSVE